MEEKKKSVTQLSGFGSIPKSKTRATFKDGVRVINGRQVSLIIAMGLSAGLSDDRLLEFIEFECDIKVVDLEHIPDGPSMQRIIQKLKEKLDA